MATTLIIPNAASISNSVKLGGAGISGIFMPAAWTAAAIGFSVSQDDVTYFGLFDEAGAEISMVVAAATYVEFTNLSRFAGFSSDMFLKLRSGTIAVPVAQGGARSLLLTTTPSPR